MESPFDKNIEFLASHFPHLLKKILPPDTLFPYTTRDIPPNIYCYNRAFHSKFPEQEALRSIEKLPVREGILILFLGLGMGYHVEKFFQMYTGEGVQPIVIEKSAEAFTILAHTRDISFLKDVRLFIGEEPSLLIEYFETINPLSFKGHRIIRLRGAFELHREYYSRIQSSFSAHLSGLLSDMLTRFSFEALWLKNFILNIPLLAGKRSISALEGSLASRPVLVIAAGPSLRKQLPMVADIAHAVYIIAVDTAVGPLVTQGIIPDFIVTLDAQYYNTHDFYSLFTDRATAERVYRRSILIADLVVCPLILKNWRGEVFFSETSHTSDSMHPDFNEGIPDTAHSLSPFLHDYFDEIESLECGGSVATTALELALYMDAQPIYVTGLDLAYTGYQTHTPGSPVYNELSRVHNRFAPLHTLMIRSIRGRKIQIVPGKNGKPVATDFIFQNYLKWLESRGTRYRTIVNVTESGVEIEGIVQRNFGKIVSELSHEKKKPDIWLQTGSSRSRNDFSGVSPRRKGGPLSKKTARSFLHALQKECSEAKSMLSADGFNRKTFMDSFGFLSNSTLCAHRLYKSSTQMKSHLLRLLRYLDRHIQKACMKLDE